MLGHIFQQCARSARARLYTPQTWTVGGRLPNDKKNLQRAPCKTVLAKACSHGNTYICYICIILPNQDQDQCLNQDSGAAKIKIGHRYVVSILILQNNLI